MLNDIKPTPGLANRYVSAFGATKMVNEACKAVSVCDFDWARQMIAFVLSADASLVSDDDRKKANGLYAMITSHHEGVSAY
ncbi:MAG: hypothetical protein FWF59_00130 [Turicibacter sp.]|nr:hypothetical protein [Turicibacter sp.]